MPCFAADFGDPLPSSLAALPALTRSRRRRAAAAVGITAILVMGFSLTGAATAAEPAARGALVVARGDGSGNNADLYLHELGTGDERKLTDSSGKFRSATWSPDGTKLAYEKQALVSGSWVGEIYVMDVTAGTAPVNISESPASDDADPEWSPDGSQVVFASNRFNGSYQVFQVALNDLGFMRRITPATSMAADTESYAPTWSPDGSHIAFAYRNAGAANPAQIFRLNLSSKELRPITSVTGDHDDPEYSPDGSLIAFATNRAAYGDADPANDVNYDLYTRSADPDVTGSETQITNHVNYESFARWLPRGTTAEPLRLIYGRSLTATDNELRIVKVSDPFGAGGDVTVLNTAEADEFEGSFRPMPGCTIAWDGGAGTSAWTTEANWDRDALPGPTDHVCIPDMITPVTVTYGSATTTIASLRSAEDVAVSSGTLTVPSVTGTATGVDVTLGDSGSLRTGTIDDVRVAWPQSATLGTGAPLTIADGSTLDLVSVDGDYYLPPGGGLINHGTIRLNKTDEFYGAGLLFNAPAGVNGDGEIVKNEAGHTTKFGGPFDNDGVLTVTAGTTTFNSSDPTSATSGTTDNADSGTFNTAAAGTVLFSAGRTNLAAHDQLRGAGTFKLTGGTLDIANHGLTIPTGSTFAMDGGTLHGSGTLAGGTFALNAAVSLTTPGLLTIADGSTLDLVSVDGDYYLPPGGGLINHGTIRLNTSDELYGSGVLDNRATGTIVKDKAGDTKITVPTDHVGSIVAQLGEVVVPSAISSGGTPAYNTTTKTFGGAGKYVTGDGGRLRFGGAMDIAINAASFILGGAPDETTTASVVDSSWNSVFRNLGSNTGALTLLDGNVTRTGSALLNSGTVTINGGSTLGALEYHQTAGTTDVVDRAARLEAGVVTFSGGQVKGSGTIVGAVTNSGATIAPGNSPGTLTVTGNFTQASGGTLRMEVEGREAGAFDVLDVGGSATLGGTLDLVTSASFTPDWSDAFSVVDAPTLQVDFAEIKGTGLGEGMSYEIEVVNGVMTLLATDTVAPSNPTATSASHAISDWSGDGTIDVSLQGAADDNSGVDGYAIVWDNSAQTLPGTTKTHEETASTVVSPALASGNAHYVHVRTVDNDGNWSAAATHLGPFFVDVTNPVTATATDASHASASWSSDRTVSVTWAGSQDAHSGLDGFAVEWNTSATEVAANPTKSVEEGVRSTTSPELASGQHWLHLRAVDQKGNWGAPVHVGPFLVDATAPAAPTPASISHTVQQWSADPTIDVSPGSSPDAHSGLAGYAVTWDTSETTEPAAVLTHAADVQTLTSPALATGKQHWLHVRTIDKAGNASPVAHLGPFFIDGTTPEAPMPTGSVPATSTWSRDRTVDVTWKNTADAESGFDGYFVEWNTSPTVSSSNPVKTPGSYTVVDNADGSATVTATSPTLPTGASHWLHVRGVDAQGNWTDAVHYGPFFIDASAPAGGALTTPGVAPGYSLAVNTKKVPQVTAAWTAATDGSTSAPQSGLKGYRLTTRKQVQGSTTKWTTTSVNASAATRKYVQTATPGATYCFTVTRIDTAGNEATSPERCVGVPLDNTALTHTKSAQWAKPALAGSYRGSVSRASVTGAQLSKTGVTTKRIALIASTCRTCGSVQVLWNGKAVGKVVNLTSKVAKNQVILPVTAFTKAQKGTLTIRITSTKKAVSIDGVALSAM